MASEARGDRESGNTTVDVTEFQQMMRGDDGATVEEAKEEISTKEREPEVIVAEDRADTRTEDKEDRKPTELQSALSTIDRLQEQINDLSRRTSSVESVKTKEPEIEWEEVAPGMRLPKNKEQWPVRLTSELLESVGIDGSIAKGLNILANTFFFHLSGSIGSGVVETVGRQQSENMAGEMRKRAFYTAYPDLVGKEDIVGATEQMLRQQNFHRRGLPDSQYAAEVVVRTRARVAALRGQTLEEYSRGLDNGKTVQRAAGGSRARSSAGGRSPRVIDSNSNDRELNDMLN